MTDSEDVMPITAQQLADSIGISSRQIRRLAQRGIIPAIGNNQFNAFKAVPAYLEYKFPTVPEGEIDISHERARKVKAEADKIERENEIEAEKYISLDELKPYIAECTSIANGIISKFKGRILEIALMMPERAVKQLDAEVQKMHQAMKELNDNTQSKQVIERPST